MHKQDFCIPILGQWDILLLNFTTIGFTNFNCYNISICKKGKLKD